MITLEVYLAHLKSMISVLEVDLDGEKYKLEYAKTLKFPPIGHVNKIQNDYERSLRTTDSLSSGLSGQLEIFNELLKSDNFNPQEYVNKNLSKFNKSITSNLRLVQHFIVMECGKLNTRLNHVIYYTKRSPLLELKVATCYNWNVKLVELYDTCTLRGYTDKDIEELNDIIINFGEFKKRENNNVSH